MTTIDLHPAHTFTLRVFTAVRTALKPYTQRQVAAVMGVTEARVSTMLSGGQNLTIETIARLLMAAETLGKGAE